MPARCSESARACARPRSVSGRSAWPCQRPARFQSLSPWRARRIVVTAVRYSAMDLGLRDRVCVVTGSTGGIGLATARMLAEEGARVVVTGRNPARVEAARGESGAALGVVCDLAEPEAPAALVREAEALVGPIDCL